MTQGCGGESFPSTVDSTLHDEAPSMDNKFAQAVVLVAFLVAFGFFYLAVGPVQTVPSLI